MKTSRPAILGLAFSVPLALALLSSASAQSYSFTDFDASGSGLANTVNGISNSGIVVGTVLNPSDGSNTSFSGTPGAFTALNLPGTASANAINSAGQVVGNDGKNAFMLDSATPGASEQLLTPVNGTTVSEIALGINDGGTIVGQYVDNGSPASALGFVDVQGNYTTLNPSGNTAVTSANGINNNGLVVGFFGPNPNQTSGNPNQTSGFLFDTLTSQYTPLTDPAVSDLEFTQFLGINDSGEAVGYYQTNALIQHGFLYNTKTSAYTFLDDPNVAPGGSTQITGISDSGEIAGFYANPNGGAQLGFVATPAAVPEASSLVSLSLLLALGVGGVYAAKKRKTAA